MDLDVISGFRSHYKTHQAAKRSKRSKRRGYTSGSQSSFNQGRCPQLKEGLSILLDLKIIQRNKKQGVEHRNHVEISAGFEKISFQDPCAAKSSVDFLRGKNCRLENRVLSSFICFFYQGTPCRGKTWAHFYAHLAK